MTQLHVMRLMCLEVFFFMKKNPQRLGFRFGAAAASGYSCLSRTRYMKRVACMGGLPSMSMTGPSKLTGPVAWHGDHVFLR